MQSTCLLQHDVDYKAGWLHFTTCCCLSCHVAACLCCSMDTTDWNPSVDKFLDVKFDAETVEEGQGHCQGDPAGRAGASGKLLAAPTVQQMPL